MLSFEIIAIWPSSKNLNLLVTCDRAITSDAIKFSSIPSPTTRGLCSLAPITKSGLFTSIIPRAYAPLRSLIALITAESKS